MSKAKGTKKAKKVAAPREQGKRKQTTAVGAKLASFLGKETAYAFCKKNKLATAWFQQITKGRDLQVSSLEKLLKMFGKTWKDLAA